MTSWITRDGKSYRSDGYASVNDRHHFIPFDGLIHIFDADCWCKPEDNGSSIFHNGHKIPITRPEDTREWKRVGGLLTLQEFMDKLDEGTLFDPKAVPTS